MSRYPWVVFEWKTGSIYNVKPATKETAVREAWLAGAGHEAFRADEAGRLHNAWAHGRMAEVERNREAAATLADRALRRARTEALTGSQPQEPRSADV